MSPSATETETQPTTTIVQGLKNGLAAKPSGLIREPMRTSGLLDTHKFFECTPIIGREYPDVQLADLMNSDKAEQYLRDLAITGSSLSIAMGDHER